MAFLRPKPKPKAQEAEAQEAPKKESGGIEIPEDLREKLAAALGREIPPVLGREDANALAKEVASKAPGVHREFIELVLKVVDQKKRKKEGGKPVRPANFLRWFYVKNKNGEWEFSRSRFIAAGTIAFFGLFVGVALLSSMGTGKKGKPQAAARTAVEQRSAPPAGAEPIDPKAGAPPSTAPPPNPPEKSAAKEPGMRATPPSALPQVDPLPPPPSNLPPPPDYEGASATGEKQGSSFILYRREKPAVEKGAFGPARKDAEKSTEELLVVSLREGEKEEKKSEIEVIEVRQAPAPKAEGQFGGFWSRTGGEDEAGVVSAASSADAKKGGGGLVVLFKRERGKEAGGILPPSGKQNPAPSAQQSGE